MVSRLYKYVRGERLDILTGGMIRFSPATSFNDAFDLFPFIGVIDPWQAGIEIASILQALHPDLGQNAIYVGALLKHYALPYPGPIATPKQLRAAEAIIMRLPEELRAQGRAADRQKTFDHLLLYAMRTGFGVLSLSETADNPLMWGHYADNFRGICVGFNADHSDIAVITRMNQAP